ncbi:MAG: hypothetical protein LCH78_15770 [Proteobacteria bacterium]|nr:hypothetical protein [Pseudomonadota bacterium]
MLDLQFGRHAGRVGVAVAFHVVAFAALAGCEKAPEAEKEAPAAAAENAPTQDVVSMAAGSMAPPEAFFRQCLRSQGFDGVIEDFSVGTIQVNEFMAVIEGNPSATVTWDQDVDGAPILRDVITDRVKGTEMTVDLKFQEFGDAAPSDHCGPKEVAITRVILNGIELQGVDKIVFVDNLAKKARP